MQQGKESVWVGLVRDNIEVREQIGRFFFDNAIFNDEAATLQTEVCAGFSNVWKDT